MFTGAVDVSIPIYEINADNYTLPITLNYQTSGIRPDQHPGWAGLGWSLNAGGAIVRVVNDFPDDADEVRGIDGSLNFWDLGYWFRHNLLNRTDWSSENYLRAVAQSGTMNIYDTAPDKFIFNFPGCSGCFYLNEKGEWAVRSSRKISVTMLGFNLSPFKKNLKQREFTGFGGFMLTTEDGVKYIFGLENPTLDKSKVNENCPLEYSIDIFSQHHNYWYATAWYLSKIILPNNHTIKFNYERVNYICQMYRSTYNRLTIQETGSGFWGTEIECMQSDYPRENTSYSGKLISPVYLSKITAPDSTTINFSRLRSTDREMSYPVRIFEWASSLFHGEEGFMYYVTEPGQKDISYCISQLNWQKLNTIIIQNLNNSSGSLIYEFRYGNHPTERLLLTELRKTYSYDPICSYQFEYNNPEKLPVYLTEETDHWGFNNGVKISNFGGLEELRKFADKRRPDSEKMKYGSLKKIIYPTGGYSRFEYEPHSYSKVVNSDRRSLRHLRADSIAGGLRIKKIINSDTGTSDGEYLSKEYFYTGNFLDGGNRSSGILGRDIQYLFEGYTVRSYNAADTEARMSIFSLQSILPSCENSYGTHIGYSEVVEKNANGSLSVFRFSNFDDGIFDNPPECVIQKSMTNYEPSAGKEMERGLLKSEEHYTSDLQLSYRKSITYERDMSPDTAYVRAMTGSIANFCNMGHYSYDEGAAWKIYTYSMREKSIEEYFYELNGNRYSKNSTTLAYNENKQLAEKTTTRYPNNITDKTSYRYLPDKPIFNLLSESKKYTFVSGDTCASEIKKYRYTHIAGTNCYVPTMEQISVNGVAKERSYTYDKKGRMTSKKEGNLTTVYVWGYKRKFVVAKIEGLGLNSVQQTLGDLDLFAAADTPDYSKIDALRSKYPGAQVTSWHYSPFLGVTSETGPSGRTVYFEYTKGMLSAKKDESGNLIEAYQYKFKTK